MLDFSKNHFELFGLPISYRVDVALLAERHRTLQRTLHPDRYVSAGDWEKRLSMQASIRVNEAFQTLKDSLERARYLLSLHGDEPGDETETTQDMEFLMEQMEMREALAEVENQSDPQAAIGLLLERLADQYNELVSRLEALLDKPSVQNLAAARESVRKLRFVAKCRHEAENLETELDELR